MMNDDVTQLEKQRLVLKKDAATLLASYDFLTRAMPIWIAEKLHDIEYKIALIERALHTLYAKRGTLQRFAVNRSTIEFIQYGAKATTTRTMEIPQQHPDEPTRFVISRITRTPTPSVYRFQLWTPYYCHHIDVTCHVSDLLAMLEAMRETVEVTNI